MHPRKVDVRLPRGGNSSSHDARPAHLISPMIKWILTSTLSIKKSLFRGAPAERAAGVRCDAAAATERGSRSSSVCVAACKRIHLTFRVYASHFSSVYISCIYLRFECIHLTFRMCSCHFSSAFISLSSVFIPLFECIYLGLVTRTQSFGGEGRRG